MRNGKEKPIWTVSSFDLVNRFMQYAFISYVYTFAMVVLLHYRYLEGESLTYLLPSLRNKKKHQRVS